MQMICLRPRKNSGQAARIGGLPSRSRQKRQWDIKKSLSVHVSLAVSARIGGFHYQ
jgi:hypothetical protein